jgi:hypothetical protein
MTFQAMLPQQVIGMHGAYGPLSALSGPRGGSVN